MKLKLARDKDLNILGISGIVDQKNYAILRAGVSQLFKTGKNKILLDMAEVEDLDPAAFMDLAQLHALAREMLGEVMVCGLSPAIRQKVAVIQPPPAIEIFASLAEALGAINDRRAPPSPAQEALDEIVNLKKRILELESASDANKLRAENASLKEQVERLQGQLVAVMLENREPNSIGDWRERHQLLEDQIADLLAQPEGGEPKKS